MFLESRMALANRGGTQIISATEWDKMGRPADPPFRVYGITNLELYQEQGEPRPIFIADYIFWTPNIENVTSLAKPPRLIITERIWMLWNGKDWTIERVQSLERKPVSTETISVNQLSEQKAGATN